MTRREKGTSASNVFDVDEDQSPSSSNNFESYFMVSDDEIEELDYIILPDDELLAEEHTDEPVSNLNSYTVPIEGYKTELQSYRINDLILLAGGRMTIEFRNEREREFLRILYIRRDLFTKDITLIGHRFLKNSHPDLGGVLDTTYQNEVCWVVGLVPKRELGPLHEIPVEAVIKKRDIDMTNALSPKLNQPCVVREDLVCRWKIINHYPRPGRCKPTQSIIRKLLAAECDASGFVPEDELRRYSRGETLKGGSVKGNMPFEKARLQEEAANRQRCAEAVPMHSNLNTNRSTFNRTRTQPPGNSSILIDLDDDIIDLTAGSLVKHQRNAPLTVNFQEMDLDEHRPTEAFARELRGSTRSRQRYTFGDSFCGAGGVSRGAQMAGLSIKWGFDRGKDQCDSWNTNFPYGRCYPAHVSDFLGANIDTKVDVLHLSPPCQPYSPANTNHNLEKDAINIDACFSIADLIQKCKPRIVTLENTAGLLQRWPEYFHRFIALFTAREYSVRWGILDMANYGVPQRRQRLIVIASGPGDDLPTFPPYTHAKVPTRNLTPWVSINQALSDIPRHCPDHDVQQAMRRGSGPKAPPNGNSIAKCVTCKGGDNFKHPNGYRGYTNREFASLQTFPLYHEFRPLGPQKISTVREQIGNAVPPRFAKVLFGWIRKALEQHDGVQGPEVMEVDDD